MSEVMHDVRPEQYASVIREMIRHENDVTNHRIMWLLIGEGFIANAYVTAKPGQSAAYLLLGLVGLLLAFSAFEMLYRSYQARGYLQFLGLQAKQGTLQEEQLPLLGWPRNRIKGWRRNAWVSPWFRQFRDLFEPWLVLPYVFTLVWTSSLLHQQSGLSSTIVLTLGILLSAAILSVSCVVLVWSQSDADEATEGSAQLVKASLTGNPRN
jgi:hypothetical protein